MPLTTLPNTLVNRLEQQATNFERMGEDAFMREIKDWSEERRQTFTKYLKLKGLRKRLHYMTTVRRNRVHKPEDIEQLQQEIEALTEALQEAEW